MFDDLLIHYTIFFEPLHWCLWNVARKIGGKLQKSFFGVQFFSTPLWSSSEDGKHSLLRICTFVVAARETPSVTIRIPAKIVPTLICTTSTTSRACFMLSPARRMHVHLVGIKWRTFIRYIRNLIPTKWKIGRAHV